MYKETLSSSLGYLHQRAQFWSTQTENQISTLPLSRSVDLRKLYNLSKPLFSDE